MAVHVCACICVYVYVYACMYMHQRTCMLQEPLPVLLDRLDVMLTPHLTETQVANPFLVCYVTGWMTALSLRFRRLLYAYMHVRMFRLYMFVSVCTYIYICAFEYACTCMCYST
jgi:hypothetical protein